MKDEDRKFLTEKMGECFHEIITEQPYRVDEVDVGSLYLCSCEKLLQKWEISRHRAHNRTFTTWEDFGAVWKWAKKQDWWKEQVWSFDGDEQCDPMEVIETCHIDPARFPELVVEWLRNADNVS